MGIFAAIFRWFSNWRLRRAQTINDAADAQFTKDASGMAAAFDAEADTLRREFDEFVDAVSQVEMAINQKRARLSSIEDELEKSQQALDGALATVEAEEKKNPTAANEAQQDAEGFLQDVEKQTADAEALRLEITDHENRAKALERQLQKMTEELAKLPIEKAETIAEVMSNEKLAAANEKLLGLQKRASERSPLDAVRRKLEESKARAQVTGDLAGIATTDKKDKYLKAAKGDAANNRVTQMLAARKAEREARTGTAAPATPTADTAGDDRPKI